MMRLRRELQHPRRGPLPLLKHPPPQTKRPIPTTRRKPRWIN